MGYERHLLTVTFLTLIIVVVGNGYDSQKCVDCQESVLINDDIQFNDCTGLYQA
jgi:hypothetical protein